MTEERTETRKRVMKALEGILISLTGSICPDEAYEADASVGRFMKELVSIHCNTQQMLRLCKMVVSIVESIDRYCWLAYTGDYTAVSLAWAISLLCNARELVAVHEDDNDKAEELRAFLNRLIVKMERADSNILSALNEEAF